MIIVASAFTESAYRDSQLQYFTGSKQRIGGIIPIIPFVENGGISMTHTAKELGKVVLNFHLVLSHVNQRQ